MHQTKSIIHSWRETQREVVEKIMASKPGILTDWPWQKLGSFKYVILAPWVAHSLYAFAKAMKGGEREINMLNFLTLPFLMWRAFHNQWWITLSRHSTAKGNKRILDRTIDFDQVDRESNWDDQILFNGVILYIGNMVLPKLAYLPMWRSDGATIITLLHTGPVEFLYYWLHRALHHHYLYSRYHSHHHSSIVTEPISSVIHPFAEHIAYFALFAIPILTTVFTGTASVMTIFCYITYIDLMNNMGHCNFELIPNWLFSIFPPLKYIMYTPSYHSLHHTQLRTNYSLFMPIYDYLYGTMDKSTDSLHATSLQKHEDAPNVVHLTHLTTPNSIYHLQIGFASFASRPLECSWQLWPMWPMTWWSMVMTSINGCTFIVERNVIGKLKLQSWAIPKYNSQYFKKWQREPINSLIEGAILEAEAKGTKVLSLGLLNQSGEINMYGELYTRKYPHLNVKVVDGSSLVVAIVLNSIPKGVTQVLIRGHFSKIVASIALSLCQRGIKVATLHTAEYEKLKQYTGELGSNLVLSSANVNKVWLVGDEFTEKEQLNAQKGTLFIPFSQFPPKKLRSDCFYHQTPSMIAPKSLENLNSCENWLPRMVISACRVAGIVHALEEWTENECGATKMFDVDKVWQATLKHGFKPFVMVP